MRRPEILSENLHQDPKIHITYTRKQAYARNRRPEILSENLHQDPKIHITYTRKKAYARNRKFA